MSCFASCGNLLVNNFLSVVTSPISTRYLFSVHLIAHVCFQCSNIRHAAAAAAAGGGFGSSVDTHHQEQQHRHLLRLPSTWGARSRGWFDATNRRPYELVPEPSLVLNVGVGDTGGRIGVGESGIGTDAGLDKGVRGSCFVFFTMIVHYCSMQTTKYMYLRICVYEIESLQPVRA